MNKRLAKEVMKQLVIYLIVFLIVSCTEKKPDKMTEPISSVSAVPKTSINELPKDTIFSAVQTDSVNNLKDEKIELETFTSIPDEFIGCGCSFFRSKKDKEAQKYIYLDAGNIAMVKLNGSVHTFEYKGEVKGKTHYNNSAMQLVVDITKTVERTDLEETADVEGTFTITQGKEKLVQKFVGSCGC
ncbi:MAG: hypothetical protein ACO1OQ_09710 [Rufibacter sp.]